MDKIWKRGDKATLLTEIEFIGYGNGATLEAGTPVVIDRTPSSVPVDDPLSGINELVGVTACEVGWPNVLVFTVPVSQLAVRNE